MINTAGRSRVRISAEAEWHPFQAGGTVTDKSREEDAIHGIVERLTNAFSATRSSAEVGDAVAKAHASFTDRPVREFVPEHPEQSFRRRNVARELDRQTSALHR
ncbi:three-helix bundle dimerization domain-containing protein [Streptomyces sp. N50]|uniref:three-helix bundle dimerization domain-containing protein n=1 Tax=Streptomyces sp. N50 TaxID=3081765 RepID=UPI00398CF1C9